MNMTFRWYGDEDNITLEQIRQIPGIKGIVSAIYNIPVGEAWPLDEILKLKKKITDAGLKFEVIESVPVHEDIKLGLETRDKYINNYNESLRNLSKAGIKVVCYNFMPVFDWTRSSIDYKLKDNSTALVYYDDVVNKMNPLNGDLKLPGWDVSYKDDELKKLLSQYQDVTEEDLWSNLEYFLKKVVPVAEECDIKLAIHPDDPPWSIFGLPRIITNKENLDRLINIVDSPSNGITLCSGSLGVDPKNNIPELIRYFGKKGRIHFAHVRNIKITGNRCFEESSHYSEDGSLDMYEIMKAYYDIEFEGPTRPDHGRMIWNEKGRPGYGLFDRALGAVYLNGINECLQKSK
ncbi:mannonate dehydratase [Clostridium cochlearium]|uniref:Mannonate dehydratase n=2 Tax=Clostridium cochlearium TaxID=1494 RepID=A0A7Y4DEW4_CLOCO|nr:mannonate dehydratase [Clostridium cochlearium]NOH17176.1 mannonate dehydratase [Clostridium cochlearium]